MEKTLTLLFKATLLKNPWRFLATSNSNSPITKVPSQFDSFTPKQKQTKILPLIEMFINKENINNPLPLNALIPSSKLYYPSANYWKLYFTNMLLEEEDEEDKVNKSKVNILLEKGNKAFELGRYKEAIQYYSQAIALDPQNADAFNNRGIAKGRLGQLKAAIADCDQAIALNPQHAVAFYNRGVAKAQLGQLKAAMEDYNQVIALNPQYPDAYNNRGVIKEKLGQLKAALADYDQAIALNPQYPEAYNNRGVIKEKLGQLKAAIADYDRAIAFNPQEVKAFYNRGVAKEKLGQFEAALADYEKALTLDPHNTKLSNDIDEMKKWILEELNADQTKPKNKPF